MNGRELLWNEICTSDASKSFEAFLSKPNLNEIRSGRTQISIITSGLSQASQNSTKVRKPGNITSKGCDYFCQVELIKFFPRGKTDIERKLTLWGT